MTEDLRPFLGPLAPLIGIWEGGTGHDIAPDDNRGTENNHYRERMIFEPMGPVNNHEQCLYGLKYSTMAWRLGEDAAFHEDMGYWLWDAQDKQVMKSFVIPRGIALIAGGTVEPSARSFKIASKEGSPCYGILHNLFIEKEFKIVGFDLAIDMAADGKSFTYDQDTILRLKGRTDLFHHRDKNTLRRIP